MAAPKRRATQREGDAQRVLHQARQLRARDEVPHNLPGINKYQTEFAAKYGLSVDAAGGGAETMYPDYLARVRAAAGR